MFHATSAKLIAKKKLKTINPLQSLSRQSRGNLSERFQCACFHEVSFDSFAPTYLYIPYMGHPSNWHGHVKLTQGQTYPEQDE
jgi:hypothetical protein